MSHGAAKHNDSNANERLLLLPKAPLPNNHHIDENFDTESQVAHRHACRGMILTALALVLSLTTLRYSTPWFFQTETPSFHNDEESTIEPTPDPNECPAKLPFCQPDDSLPHRVPTGQKGFPSFWDYAGQGAPINVTYDGRSFFLNNERALFLSGSMHPNRATKETWEQALDTAVQNGLNMITIYVFWAEHQPLPGSKMDWTLPAGRGKSCVDNSSKNSNKESSPCGWDLADAIRAAGQRGLFVHARIGPYVCAEYSYGGIPEWVALSSSMKMRRLDEKWLDAMETYVTSTIHYLAANMLFAHQGGPIIAGQIENELGEERVDESYMDMPVADDDNPTTTSNDDEQRELKVQGQSKKVFKTVSEPSVQDYADWCGSLVMRLAPKVVWTMCNGLSANNTIVTCNGECSTKWLEDYGSSGRIQVDQPPLWTEDEGGFQIWGDEANAPSDYFWGRTARAMAFDALRWFARGGTHLNYYMFWGAYNRGRASASGIMNAYATDAPVCPSGEPRQPKFGHFSDLHRAIQYVTPTLLASPSALNKGIQVEHRKDDDEWETNGKQLMFVYRTDESEDDDHEVVFVENDADYAVVVKLYLGISGNETFIIKMSPYSAILIRDGAFLFDSSKINPSALAYERKVDPVPAEISSWSFCAEPIETFTTILGDKPVEQTLLNNDAGISSDYAWYETEFESDVALDDASIFVQTEKGSALTLYMNGAFQGEAYNRQHAEGNITLHFKVSVNEGHNTISVLSESLGYLNLIGRWGVSTGAKVKGITGDVILASNGKNRSLVGSDSTWKSSPGLNGAEYMPCFNSNITRRGALGRAQWSTATFNTPIYDPDTHSLFLSITRGRGHVWLNNHDLGRFWNITRGESTKYSQKFYFLPFDYLEVNGGTNKLVFFDALGSDLSSTHLVMSWLEKIDSPNFEDEVDFSEACM